MKSLLTLMLVLFSGTSAFAQNRQYVCTCHLEYQDQNDSRRTETVRVDCPIQSDLNEWSIGCEGYISGSTLTATCRNLTIRAQTQASTTLPLYSNQYVHPRCDY